MDGELKQVQLKMVDAVADAARINYRMLMAMGDGIAQRFGYDESGIEACQRYLCDRYAWLPGAVRSLSQDDVLFLLRELLDARILATLPPPAFGSGVANEIEPNSLKAEMDAMALATDRDPPSPKPRPKPRTAEEIRAMREQNRQ